MNIYVASSWKNERHDEVVEELRKLRCKVYNYREDGFSWDNVDPEWQKWDVNAYEKALLRKETWDGFSRDFRAMCKADVFVGIAPFGASVGLELGWASGKKIPTVLLLSDPPQPELMTCMLGHTVTTIEELIKIVNRLNKHRIITN